MSDSRQNHSTNTTSELNTTNTKNLSSSTSSNRNKFTLIEANREHSEFGTRKTTNSNNTCELNNNSIPQATTLARELGGGSGAFRLDLNPQSRPAEAATLLSSAPASAITIQSGDHHHQLSSSNISTKTSIDEHQHIPNYSSIFTSTSLRRSLSPQYQIHQQQTVVSKGAKVASQNGKAPLIKQNATADVAQLTPNRMSESKKWSAFTYDSLKGGQQQQLQKDTDLDEEDDDLGDAEINERIPFSLTSMSAKQNRSSSLNNTNGNTKRASPESQQEQRCEMANHQQQQQLQRAQNAHTKISFNETRPPSFNTCQMGGCNHHEMDFGNRKLDWREQAFCLKCDCSNCHKKAKFTEAYHGRAPEIEFGNKYSKTKSMHLILKSIILVLLTLLLLMLVISMIVASHYLPQVFDRIVNVSRSFNVTIAG